MFKWIDQFLMKVFQEFQFLATSLLTFLQITSDCLIQCFLMLSSGETNTNLEDPIFTIKSILFHSFQMVKPLSLPSCKHSLMPFSQCSPKILCRNPFLRPRIAFPFNQPCIIPFKSHNIVLYNSPSLTSIQQNAVCTCFIKSAFLLLRINLHKGTKYMSLINPLLIQVIPLSTKHLNIHGVFTHLTLHLD